MLALMVMRVPGAACAGETSRTSSGTSWRVLAFRVGSPSVAVGLVSGDCLNLVLLTDGGVNGNSEGATETAHRVGVGRR